MEAVFKIVKTDLKNKIKRYFILQRPEQSKLLTKKLLNECFIFGEGFIQCLNSMGEEPMTKNDVDSFIIQNCIDWIVKKIDNG